MKCEELTPGSKRGIKPWKMMNGIAAVVIMGAVGGGLLFWQNQGRETIPAPAPLSKPASNKPKHPDLVIADFNSPNRLNNLGGIYGSWNSQSPDPLGNCSEENAPGEGPDGSQCWRIICAISEPQSYGGVWMNLQLVDGSDYKALQFRARANKPELNFVMELKLKKEGGQIVSKKVPVHVGSEWETIEIPLDSFGLPALTPIDQIVINFDQTTTGPMDAVLLIDDLSFLKK